MTTYQRNKKWVTRVTVADQQQYDHGPITMDGTLIEVTGSFNRALNSIPEEFRKNAYCEIDSVSSYEDTHYAHILINYERPATEDEIAQAVQREKDMKLARERKEQAEYERLRAKFEAT